MSKPIADAGKKVDQSLKENKDSFKSLGDEIKNNFTGAIKGAVVAYLGMQGIQKVTQFLKEARLEYKEAVQMQLQLKTALGFTSQALNDQADALGKKLVMDNEEITAVQIKLANYVKNEEQVRRLTPAVLDLAAATGMGMASAAEMVARGIADDNGELGRFKIAIEGARGSAERIDSVIRGITTQMGGQAEAVAKSRDRWDSLAVAINNAKENLWGFLVGPTVEAGLKSQYETAKKVILEGGMEIEEGFVKLTPQLKAKYEEIIKNYELAINKAKVINQNKTMGPQQQSPEDAAAAKTKSEKEQEERSRKQQEELERNRQQNLAAGEVALNDYREFQYKDAQITYEKQQAKLEAEKAYAQNVLYINNVMQDELNASSEESFKLWVKQEKQKADLEKQQKIQSLSFSLGTMASIFAGQQKYIAAYKTFAVAQAIMDTYAAANTALKGSPPPFNFIAAGVTVAAGLANVAKISQQKAETGTAYMSGPTLVGERGPEYVNLPRGSQVYNNTQTRNMTTNAALNVTIMDSSGNITETIRAQLRSGQGDQLVRDIQAKMARQL